MSTRADRIGTTTREKLLGHIAQPVAQPTRRRDDVILGLLTSAQASVTAAMQMLNAQQEQPAGSADPATCQHVDRQPIGGFGDEHPVEFCFDCGHQLDADGKAVDG